MEQRIVLQEISHEAKEFLALPKGVAKNLIYKEKMMNHMCRSVSVFLKDDKLHYSDTVYKVACVNHNYFLRLNTKHGFTYEKGKLKTWFGTNIKRMHIQIFIDDYLKLTWIDKHDYALITAGILAKIIAGKITNKRDLYEAWFKVNRIKCTVGEYMNARKKVVEAYETNNNPYYHSFLFMRGGTGFVHWMYKLNLTVTSIDHFFRNITTINKYQSIFFDCLEQALVLEQKINPLWSEKRLNEEHTRMTREIMQHQIHTVEDKSVKYKDTVDKILNLMNTKGVEFLDNKRKVFMEGTIMNHCIYTNYWDRIEKGEMFAFNFTYGDESGTLTFNNVMKTQVRTKDYSFHCIYNQYLGKRNKSLSEKATTTARNFVTDFERIINTHIDLKQELADSIESIKLNNEFAETWLEEALPF